MLIRNGKVHKVGEDLEVPEGCQVFDATDRLVMPGGIDTHTHMQLPFMGSFAVDDYYYGTRAALSGGTTMIIDFVLGGKNKSLIDNYNLWLGMAMYKIMAE